MLDVVLARVVRHDGVEPVFVQMRERLALSLQVTVLFLFVAFLLWSHGKQVWGYDCVSVTMRNEGRVL